MDYRQTDSDANNQSSVGVGNASASVRSILDARPSWAEDGFGLRGPQRPNQQEQVSPYPMDFHFDNAKGGNDSVGGGGNCSPGTSGIPTTGKWVWGVVNGSCQWLETESCPAE